MDAPNRPGPIARAVEFTLSMLIAITSAVMMLELVERFFRWILEK